MSGPAGHFGVHVGTAHDIEPGGSGTITMNVAERVVRMRAVTLPGFSPPSTPVTLTVGSGGDAFDVSRSLQVGSGDDIVYVPAGTASSVALAATAPSGWTAAVTPSAAQPGGGSGITFEVRLVPNLTITFCTPASAPLRTDYDCHVDVSGPSGLNLAGLSVEVSVRGTPWSDDRLTNGSGRASFTVPAARVGMADFIIDASVTLAGVEVASASQTVTVTGHDEFDISLCSSGNATSGSTFSCLVTLEGPSGYGPGGREVSVEVTRGSTSVWTGTVTTAANGTQTITVPVTAVGSSGFTLRVAWTVPGISTPFTDSRTVAVTGGPGGGGGGGGGGGTGDSTDSTDDSATTANDD